MGAQKAGTSWLHHLLSCHPNCNFGFTKEYHVLEYIHKKDKDKHNSFFYSLLQRHELEKIVNFRTNLNEYFDYFANILDDPNISITGDLSPIYSILTPDVLNLVKVEFEKRKIKVKPIFLMRDPIYRLCSMVKHLIKYEYKITNEMSNNEFNFKRLLYSLYLTPEDRCRYDQTFTNYSSVFDIKDIYYTLYEELFTTDALNKLKNFLELEFIDTNLMHYNPNKSDINLRIEKHEYYYLKRGYEGIFDFCKLNLKLPVDQYWKYKEEM